MNDEEKMDRLYVAQTKELIKVQHDLAKVSEENTELREQLEIAEERAEFYSGIIATLKRVIDNEIV